MSRNLWCVRVVRTDAFGIREQLDCRVIPSRDAAGPAIHDLMSWHRGKPGVQFVVEPSFMNEAGVNDPGVQEVASEAAS